LLLFFTDCSTLNNHDISIMEVNMDFHLTEKVAVVTGASKGIGLAITTALAQEGAKVVAASREAGPALAQLAERFPVLPVAVDLLSPGGAAHLIEQAVKTYGRVDVLVNNVGGSSFHPSGFLSIDDAAWVHVFEWNLMSAVRACRATLPVMIKQEGGSIVNISSHTGRQPELFVTEYGAAKAALINLSKALAEEFGPKGVRVNVVSPGPVRTPALVGPGQAADQIAQIFGMDREAVLAQLPQMYHITLGRMIEPEEVANVVLFLASDRASMVTGANYIIDGGVMKTI
jgi:NAD(P)-dependent dehydrogenase (short-subunit alcohol dehydrogenase family)